MTETKFDIVDNRDVTDTITFEMQLGDGVITVELTHEEAKSLVMETAKLNI